jgi:hypothetical protein
MPNIGCLLDRSRIRHRRRRHMFTITKMYS